MELYRLVLVCLVIAIALSGDAQKALAQSDNVLMPLIDDSPTASDSKPEKKADTHDDFKVTTRKVATDDSGKAIVPIKPGFKASYYPGSIEFIWRAKASKKKFTIIVENIYTEEKSSHNTTKKNLSLTLSSGKYRWQVVEANSKPTSQWHFFEVLDEIRQVSDAGLKSVNPLTIDNPNSEFEAKVDHQTKEVKAAAVDDKKIQEYRQQKLEAEKQAKEMERQVKAARLEAQRAMKVAQDQQAHLEALRQEKINADKLLKQRMAKMEAERIAKIKSEKLAKEKEKKLLAQKEREVKVAKLSVERAQAKFQNLVKEAKLARTDLEAAMKILSEKTQNYRQAANKIEDSAADRVPASQPEIALPPKAAPAPAVQAPAAPASKRAESPDLKWSDE